MPRKDLNKIMTERERTRGWPGMNKGRGKQDGKLRNAVSSWPFKGESSSPHPFKEGMKVDYDTWDGRKTFDENLGALWGFLRKSVGKKWDKVYSEICSVFDKRKVINQHILIHLAQNVEQHTFFHEGKVCFLDVHGYRSGDRNRQIAESSCDYYVHPVSKILLPITKKNYKKVIRQKMVQEKKEKAKHLQLLARFNNKTGEGSRYAIKLSDVWYEISIVKAPEPTKHRRLNGKGETEYYTRFPQIEAVSIHGAVVTPEELMANKGYYVCRKAQLNKKRIRDLGLA